MEYVHNFNGFLNESELNEGANHGDMTAVLGGGDDKAFSKFFKTVKSVCDSNLKKCCLK